MPRSSLILFAAVAIGSAALLPAAEPKPVREWDAIVARVIDGDTLELENGEIVRLLGIDTPESVKPGTPVEAGAREATAYTRGALLGRRVHFELDRQARPSDRYGRTLAYAWRDGETLFNLEAVAQGYAFAENRYPFGRPVVFCAAEREARAKRRGLFAPRVGVLDPRVESKRGCMP